MTLSWVSIIRLGLVQMCLGAIVVLTTSTLNRLMVVELALPAVLPAGRRPPRRRSGAGDASIAAARGCPPLDT